MTNQKTINITLHGSFTARCVSMGLEVTQSRGSTISALCRQIIASGADPHTPVKVTREGTPCFNLRPVWAWAGQTVVEEAKRSARFVPYRADSIAKLNQVVCV